jgi:hypothetical protein
MMHFITTLVYVFHSLRIVSNLSMGLQLNWHQSNFKDFDVMIIAINPIYLFIIIYIILLLLLFIRFELHVTHPKTSNFKPHPKSVSTPTLMLITTQYESVWNVCTSRASTRPCLLKCVKLKWIDGVDMHNNLIASLYEWN